MQTTTFLYRLPSRRPIICAFLLAIAIHLAAVALASHRENLSVPATAVPPDVTGIDLEEPPPPSPPDVEIALPPPPSFHTEFVEEAPPARPVSKRGVAFVPIRRSPVTSVPAAGVSNPRPLALSALRPAYPYEARRQHITGSGIVSMQVDPASGAVIDATMEQSAGNPILDQATLSAFRRWRFRIGAPGKVRVPITFTLTGAQF